MSANDSDAQVGTQDCLLAFDSKETEPVTVSTSWLEGAVAFDIETSGLGPQDTITCICVCGFAEPVTGLQTRVWTRTWPLDANDMEIISILNQATKIIAFNGGSFDIPFMQRVWQLSNTQVGLWMAKLVDPLYVVRGLFGTSACVKLQILLQENKLAGKCGTGAGAIDLWHEGRLHELYMYCAQDTEQTLRLLQACEQSDGIKWNDFFRIKIQSQKNNDQSIVRNSSPISYSVPSAWHFLINSSDQRKSEARCLD